MANEVKFNEDLKFGLIAENKVYTRLLKSPNTLSIIDCSKDKYYQALDIDFLVLRKDGEVIKYEVKHDRKADETGNIVYETYSNNNIGCLARSHADYVFYITEKHDYIFSLKEVRRYIKEFGALEYIMGDGAKGYLLNTYDLVQKGIVKEVE